MYHCLPHTLLQNAGISVTKTTDFYWFLYVSTQYRFLAKDKFYLYKHQLLVNTRHKSAY